MKNSVEKEFDVTSHFAVSLFLQKQIDCHKGLWKTGF